MSTYRHILLFFAFMPVVIPPTASSVSSNTIKCPDGYLLGLNNECIKKFVPPQRKECPQPDLRFGSYELQIGGRVVYYMCEDGWTLAPPDFASAVCKLGEWSKPQPQCVRPGCAELQPPHNARLTIELDGAIAKFACNNELEILGESVLGCDGEFWNATVPSCVMTTTTAKPFTGDDRLLTSNGYQVVQCRWLLPSILLIIFAII